MRKAIDLISISSHSKEIFHKMRWGRTGVCCPHCGSVNVVNTDPDQLHRCRDCDHRFSDTSGTIFHCTKLPLAKWLYAIYLFCSQSRGISSYNLARLIGVSQPTAYRVLMLIRSVIVMEFDLGDTIHVDEIFLGADWGKKPFKKKLEKATAMGLTLPNRPHTSDPIRDKYRFKKLLRSVMHKAASMDKTCVLGIRAYNKRSLLLLPTTLNESRSLVKSQINSQITQVTRLITDETDNYNGLTPQHSKNCHSKGIYISDDGYSNNPLEGSFSHLRRMFRGIYQWCSRDKLYLYLNEFSFRWSYWNMSIEERMEMIFDWA